MRAHLCRSLLSRMFGALTLAWLLSGGIAPVCLADPFKVENIDEQATHEQVSLIKVATSSLNAFCLDRQGRLLAACGQGPGEIRLLSESGEVLETWPVDFKPEAINTTPNGEILVAGVGQLLRLSADGQVIRQTEAPHAVLARKNKDELRKQARQQLEMQEGNNTVGVQISMLSRLITSLNEKAKKQELNEQEESILKVIPDQVESLKKIQAEQEQEQEPEKEPASKISEQRVDQMLESMLNSKLRVASISTDGESIFVAAPAPLGYTYNVWRMDDQFGDGKVVVNDLRGCCGHMDVQASAAGLFVAENARHRVATYGVDGSEQAAWGQADRTGLTGFSSCCNPMNVCLSRTGDVFTAESTTGRIKCFAPDGTLKAYVGDVKLVPGCKNVSIAVTEDHAVVYMLDMTRNHIVKLARKSPPAGKNDATTTSLP